MENSAFFCHRYGIYGLQLNPKDIHTNCIGVDSMQNSRQLINCEIIVHAFICVHII